MKKILMTLALSWILIPSGYTQSPKNILDYYLLLPEKYFGCELPPKASQSERLSAIKHQNIKIGYIKSV